MDKVNTIISLVVESLLLIAFWMVTLMVNYIVKNLADYHYQRIALISILSIASILFVIKWIRVYLNGDKK